MRRGYYAALKFKNSLRYIFSRGEINACLEKILNEADADCVDLFYFRFGWSCGSFQRAQHIALNMAAQGTLVFYGINPVREKIQGFFEKKADNLYLIDIDNPVVTSCLKKALFKDRRLKIFHSCSTNIFLKAAEVKKYQKLGSEILYEYIDEISPGVSGYIPGSFYKLHERLAGNKNIFVVSSAIKLYEKIADIRGEERHILAQNGAEYDHWQTPADSYKKFEDIKQIKDKNKPVIGYFGALAVWFDYKLLYETARIRRDCEFVLIGWEYDGSFTASGLMECANVHFLGAKDYTVLNSYVTAFDAACIPFLINDITLSTSPVKLYEYMAAGKPVICTPMPECAAEPLVKIIETPEQFAAVIDECLGTADVYGLKAAAQLNGWRGRVSGILNEVKKSCGRQ